MAKENPMICPHAYSIHSKALRSSLLTQCGLSVTIHLGAVSNLDAGLTLKPQRVSSSVNQERLVKGKRLKSHSRKYSPPHQ